MCRCAKKEHGDDDVGVQKGAVGVALAGRCRGVQQNAALAIVQKVGLLITRVVGVAGVALTTPAVLYAILLLCYFLE